MSSTSKLIICIVFVAVTTMLSGCIITYKFNGASIDYTTTHSISIADFPNNAPLVNPTLSNEFTETLRDQYSKQTRLTILKKDGDLQLEGEITGYDVVSQSISANTSYAAETKLTVTVHVRYTNTVNPTDNFERNFTAFRTFDSNQMLTDVQDQLCTEISKEIAEQIYNETVAKW